jgi:hypothetical protein
MAVNRRVSLRLRGLDQDEGDVRFDDFIAQLDILKKALVETQRIYSDKTIAYYKVVDLRHSSPAQIVLEAVPSQIENERDAILVVEKFFQSLDEIERGEYPDGFTYETFQAYKDITKLKESNKLTEITVSKNGDTPKVLEGLSYNIEQIMGTDEYETGSYSGMLEYLNIHGNQNVFNLYPLTPNLPKLKCVFPQRLRADAIAAVGQRVRVFGEKKYKPKLKSALPYEMRVTDIEVYPPDEELPKLGDLRGIAPDATGELSSEEFITGLRHEWQ